MASISLVPSPGAHGPKVLMLMVKFRKHNFGAQYDEEYLDLMAILKGRFGWEVMSLVLGRNTGVWHQRVTETFRAARELYFDSGLCNTIVLYIAGHGNIKQIYNDRGFKVFTKFELSGTRCFSQFIGIESFWIELMKFNCDVLSIIDACHAAAATDNLDVFNGFQKHIFESLFASKADQESANPGPFSLTSMLCQVLEKIADEGKTTSVRTLATQVRSRIAVILADVGKYGIEVLERGKPLPVVPKGVQVNELMDCVYFINAI